MTNPKPFSQACENNKQPILDVLQRVFADRRRVLEIGSGTGQHAVYFAGHLPHLQWYTSDLPEYHAGINAWLTEAQLPNLHPPVTLDVTDRPWPGEPVDAVFSANTLHIMSWQAVKAFFRQLPHQVEADTILAIYGPFNFHGEFTSDSNRRFDQILRNNAPHQGIRDFDDVNELAKAAGFEFLEDNAMPANNRLMVWEKR